MKKIKTKRPKQILPRTIIEDTTKLSYKTSDMPQESQYIEHSNSMGEFVYSYSGIMELLVNDVSILVTPHFGVWLPPNINHTGLNQSEMSYGVLYVPILLSKKFPDEACTLSVNQLTKAILDHLKDNPTTKDSTPEDERLLRVLCDQLAAAPRTGSYLPLSDDPLIMKAFTVLEKNIEKSPTLTELSLLMKVSERTLARRFSTELNMTFSEWKQRFVVIKALRLIQEGKSVAYISKELGYNSSSAFIVMFKKLTGETPAEY